MVRPPLSEWEDVFGFTEDPTPGDPEILEQLASEYQKVSNDAEDARSVVSRLDSKDLGEGKSMAKLREKLGELPDQVNRLQSSYEKAADTVKVFATQLRESQEKADRALRDGREAKDRLASAVAVAAAAGARVEGLDRAEAPPPDDEAAASSARQAMADAKASLGAAQNSVENAEADLEAARLLALDAQELRVSDAQIARRSLEEAEDEAVEGKSVWEKILDWVGAALGVLGAIIGVVGLFLSGPFAIVAAVAVLGIGIAGVGITIAKAVLTGELDVVGLVLGIVGVAFGGAAVFNSVKAVKGVATALSNFGSKIAGMFKTIGALFGKGPVKPPLPGNIPLNNLDPGGNPIGALAPAIGRIFNWSKEYTIPGIPGLLGQFPKLDVLARLTGGIQAFVLAEAPWGFETVWYGKSIALIVVATLNDFAAAIYGLLTMPDSAFDTPSVQLDGDFPEVTEEELEELLDDES